MTLFAFLQHLGFAGVLALFSAAVVRLMIAFPILDHPNARSAHVRPTPRGGGLGVVIAFTAGMLVLYLVADFARVAEPQFIGVILAALAIAGVALADDVRDLSARLRLAAQAGAALVAVASGLVVHRLALPWFGVVDLGWVGLVLTLIWIVGCTNAVNFMDGLDGLVGEAVEQVSSPEVLIHAAQQLPGDAGLWVGAGKGLEAYADRLAVLGLQPARLQPLAEPHAREVAWLGAAAFAAGRAQPPEAAIPVYLRDQVAHPPRP